MNALFLDAEGNVFDYVGGLADLKAGRVRFVGDPATRIREDVLRLLRFYRFFAFYGKTAPDGPARRPAAPWPISCPTFRASAIAAETLRLLAAPDPLPALAMMQEDGVLSALLPEASGLERLEASGRRSKARARSAAPPGRADRPRPRSGRVAPQILRRATRAADRADGAAALGSRRRRIGATKRALSSGQGALRRPRHAGGGCFRRWRALQAAFGLGQEMETGRVPAQGPRPDQARHEARAGAREIAPRSRRLVGSGRLQGQAEGLLGRGQAQDCQAWLGPAWRSVPRPGRFWPSF